MGKPTEDEYKHAMDMAGRMRETDHDQHHLAKVLLNLNYRVNKLEKLLWAAKLYMHSGQATTEHRNLLHAIEEADLADSGVQQSQF